jgi:hypothetical protein
MLPHPVQVAMAQPAAELDEWHQQQQQQHYGIAVSAGDGGGGGRPPAPEQHPGLWLMWEDGQGDTEFARLEPAGPRWRPSLAALTPTTINHHSSWDGVTAGSSRAMRDEAGDAGAGSGSTIASRSLSCSACGAVPSVGCLCQLQSLEVVGPLCGVEVQQLGRLTALTALTLRCGSHQAHMCTDSLLCALTTVYIYIYVAIHALNAINATGPVCLW